MSNFIVPKNIVAPSQQAAHKMHRIFYYLLFAMQTLHPPCPQHNHNSSQQTPSYTHLILLELLLCQFGTVKIDVFFWKKSKQPLSSPHYIFSCPGSSIPDLGVFVFVVAECHFRGEKKSWKKLQFFSTFFQFFSTFFKTFFKRFFQPFQFFSSTFSQFFFLQLFSTFFSTFLNFSNLFPTFFQLF